MKIKLLRPKILFYSIQSFLLIQFLLIWTPGNTSEVYIGYSDYHIVTDFSFPYKEYFAEMRLAGVNLQRIWITGYGNVVPTVHERMPFSQIRGKYDLARIDPAYINRLRNVLAEAKAQDQKVMLTLFDRWSMSALSSFIRTPWYYKNNKQRLLQSPMPDFHDLADNRLRRIQDNYVRAIIKATKDFDPIYEIMNEARIRPDCSPVIDWHHEVASWILEEYPEAQISINVTEECEKLHRAEWVDIISLHYGQWEHGICEAIESQPQGKKIIIDTDGAFKYRDDNQLVKRWLEETMACSGWFNHKDEIRDLDREALEILGNVKGTLYRRHLWRQHSSVDERTAGKDAGATNFQGSRPAELVIVIRRAPDST